MSNATDVHRTPQHVRYRYLLRGVDFLLAAAPGREAVTQTCSVRVCAASGIARQALYLHECSRGHEYSGRAEGATVRMVDAIASCYARSSRRRRSTRPREALSAPTATGVFRERIVAVGDTVSVIGVLRRAGRASNPVSSTWELHVPTVQEVRERPDLVPLTPWWKRPFVPPMSRQWAVGLHVATLHASVVASPPAPPGKGPRLARWEEERTLPAIDARGGRSAAQGAQAVQHVEAFRTGRYGALEPANADPNHVLEYAGSEEGKRGLDAVRSVCRMVFVLVSTPVLLLLVSMDLPHAVQVAALIVLIGYVLLIFIAAIRVANEGVVGKHLSGVPIADADRAIAVRELDERGGDLKGRLVMVRGYVAAADTVLQTLSEPVSLATETRRQEVVLSLASLHLDTLGT